MFAYRASSNTYAGEGLLEVDWLLLAEDREWWGRHEVLFVQRVLRRRRPGRFMCQAAEEADADLKLFFPGA